MLLPPLCVRREVTHTERNSYDPNQHPNLMELSDNNSFDPGHVILNILEHEGYIHPSIHPILSFFCFLLRFEGWNKWVKIAVEWKIYTLTKLMGFWLLPLDERKNSRDFRPKITSSENPMKQTRPNIFFSSYIEFCMYSSTKYFVFSLPKQKQQRRRKNTQRLVYIRVDRPNRIYQIG